MKVTKRASTFYIVKRVPKRYEAIEPRKQIWISLHTDSETDATRKAPDVWDHQVGAWEARLAGETDDVQAQLDAAHELASIRGFKYLPAPRVAALPIQEILTRIDAVPVNNGKPQTHETIALLGGVERPRLTISQALELYWTLAKDKTFGKSDDQIRKWSNPRIKAIKNLISVIGDKALTDIECAVSVLCKAWPTARSRSLSPYSMLQCASRLPTLLHFEVIYWAH